MGLAGLLILSALIINGFKMLSKAGKAAQEIEKTDKDFILYTSHGLFVGLVIAVTCGLTGSLIYIESFWWFLILPVCLTRAMDNLLEDIKLRQKNIPTDEKALPRRRASKHRKNWKNIKNRAGD